MRCSHCGKVCRESNFTYFLMKGLQIPRSEFICRDCQKEIKDILLSEKFLERIKKIVTL
jgi:phage FluMu protein Com